MNLRGLSLRDLSYVVAVAEHGHFGHAAEACHVSQPSLSVGVKRVEDVLGYPIFERANRGVLVTEAGRDAVDRARSVLSAAEDLVKGTTKIGPPLHGTFALGAIATVGPYLLPHLLAPLRRAYPDLNLTIEEGLTDHLLARLNEGALDAVLLSPPIPDSGLALLSLYREDFRLIVPAQSALAAQERVTDRDLDPSQAILLEDGHCLRDQALDICGATVGRNRHAAMSLETLKAMVAAGTGYSLIPETAITDPEPLADLVIYREIDGISAGRTVALCYRETCPQVRDMEAFATLVQNNLPPGASAL